MGKKKPTANLDKLVKDIMHLLENEEIRGDSV